MKIFLILVSIFFSIPSNANSAHFRDFLKDLETYYFINSKHFLNIADEIYLARPSLLQQWGIINTDAEATYNGWTNTIVLSDEIFILKGNNHYIKNFVEFNLNQKVNYYFVRATTIIHELTHADVDIFVENDRSDFGYQLIKNDLPNWFHDNFDFNENDATQELMGYTAGLILETLNSELEAILLRYGLSLSDKSCFTDIGLRRIAKRFALTSSSVFEKGSDQEYLLQMIPDYIFIKGESLDIKKMPIHLKKKVITFFSRRYHFPLTRRELVEKMNQSIYLELLRKCYDFL